MFPMQGCIYEIIAIVTMVKLFINGSALAWVILGGFIIEFAIASILKQSLSEYGQNIKVNMSLALLMNFIQWGLILICIISFFLGIGSKVNNRTSIVSETPVNHEDQSSDYNDENESDDVETQYIEQTHIISQQNISKKIPFNESNSIYSDRPTVKVYNQNNPLVIDPPTHPYTLIKDWVVANKGNIEYDSKTKKVFIETANNNIVNFKVGQRKYQVNNKSFSTPLPAKLYNGQIWVDDSMINNLASLDAKVRLIDKTSPSIEDINTNSELSSISKENESPSAKSNDTDLNQKSTAYSQNSIKILQPNALSKGMSKDEVIKILGKPDFDGGTYIKYGMSSCLNFSNTGLLEYWVGISNNPSPENLERHTNSNQTKTTYNSSTISQDSGSIPIIFNIDNNSLFVDQIIEVYGPAGNLVGKLSFQNKKGSKRIYSGEIQLPPGSYNNLYAFCFVSLGKAFARSPHRLDINFSQPLQVSPGINPSMSVSFNL